MAGTYRDLLVWQKAKSLALQVYRATECLPKAEVFGLTAQIRRAAISVVSNIAEGQGRGSKREFANFLCISRGSLLELQTQLEIAEEPGMGRPEELRSLRERCFETLGLLNRLLRAMEIKAKV